jgi:hypothetical protein
LAGRYLHRGGAIAPRSQNPNTNAVITLSMVMPPGCLVVGCCERLPSGFTIVCFHMKTKGRFTPRPWPSDDDARLKTLVQTHNMREVARLMGKKYDSVRYRVKRLGLKVARSHEVSFAERARAARHADKHGLQSAAKHFGVHPKTILRYVREHKATLKEFARELTPDDVRAVRGAAYSLAVRSGKSEVADDFASFCCMIRLTRQETKIQLKNLWIDYLRVHYGRTDNEEGLARLHANQTMAQVTESADPLDGVQVASPERTPSRVLAVAEILGLEPIDKILWMLIHQEGYELAQIAPWFGITESGVCLRLKRMLGLARSAPYQERLKDVLD